MNGSTENKFSDVQGVSQEIRPFDLKKYDLFLGHNLCVWSNGHIESTGPSQKGRLLGKCGHKAYYWTYKVFVAWEMKELSQRAGGQYIDDHFLRSNFFDSNRFASF